MSSRPPFAHLVLGVLVALMAIPVGAAAQWGHVSVSAGPTITPSPVVLTQNFTVSFSLREINGDYRTFESIAVAILRNDNSLLFDLATYSNVTIGANQTWSRSPSGQIYGNPAGTYKVAIRGKLAGGDWFTFSTIGTLVNPKSFTVVEPTGYVAVSSGVTVSPNPVDLEQNFAVSFSLRETTGWSITFEQIAVDIRRADNSLLFNLATYNNVAFSPNQTRSYAPSGQIYDNPAGTYKAIVRGRVAGGAWFDFTITGSAVNPRSFTVTQPTGYVSVSAGATVSPDPVSLEQNFTVGFSLRETSGWPITFEQIAVDIRRADNSLLFNLATYDNVVFSANQTRSYAPSGQVYDNPAGTYKAIVRGRVAGGEWFDFSVTGAGVNPRSFTVTQPTGYASVSSGATVSPDPTALDQLFTVSFSLLETAGWPITFEQVAVAILRDDGSHLFDLAMYDDVTIGAGQTWSRSPSGSVFDNPPGTYKAVVRGRVAGGEWFDFSVTGSGVNPRSFEVSALGYVSASALSLSPLPVVLDQAFTANVVMQEWQGGPITFEQFAISVLEGEVVLLDVTTQSDVHFAPGQRRTWTVGGVLPYSGGANPPGTYRLAARGRVAGGQWFVFSTIDGATNPRSFPAVLGGTTTGYVSVAGGVSVASPAYLDEPFGVSFALRERTGFPITFAEIRVEARRGGQYVATLASWPGVPFTALQTRNYFCDPTIPAAAGANPPGVYEIVVRGTVDGSNWFDFSVIDGGVNPRSFSLLSGPATGYHVYFEEAGVRYGIPANLLKAVGHVESSWNQAAIGGDGYGVMQLEQATHLLTAQRLRADYPAEYGAMTEQQVVDLLKQNSDAGAQANIRGGAAKLRWDADNVDDPDLVYAGEPLQALETWFMVLAWYNGGGDDLDITSTNYPYRVYNCFLSGIVVDGDVRVPQIPITLPPHFWFRTATTDEEDELGGNDHNLIPRTPEGFLRVTLPFHACRDLGYLHDNQGLRLTVAGCEPTSFHAHFPIAGSNAYNAAVNAVYDYALPVYATHDGYVVDYRFEVGDSSIGANLDGYMQQSRADFEVNGHYTGSRLGQEYLFYDGHYGYDYRTGADLALYATGPGTFIVDSAPGATCATLSKAHIDHGNGYKTYYLHCKQFKLTSGTTITQEQVDEGCLIGYSGEAGSCKSPHLHLNIQRDGKNICPYGWQAKEAHPFTVAANGELWSSDAPRNLRTVDTKSVAIALEWLPPPTEASPSAYFVYRTDEVETAFIGSVPGHETTFTDPDAVAGACYTYTVTAIFDGLEGAESNPALGGDLALVGVAEGPPARAGFATIAPNPFNPTVTVAYEVTTPGMATLRVYSLRGELVRTLRRENLPAGRYREVWQGDDERGRPVATGAYILRLETGGGAFARKVTLLR